MTEGFKVVVSKTTVQASCTGGSNPPLSAMASIVNLMTIF